MPMCSTTTRWGADADAAAKLQNWWIHHLFGQCIHLPDQSRLLALQ
jgi:hypothetical protein